MVTSRDMITPFGDVRRLFVLPMTSRDGVNKSILAAVQLIIFCKSGACYTNLRCGTSNDLTNL